MNRPIELVRDLFASISPRLFDEAIDPLVDVSKNVDDERLIKAAINEAKAVQPEWMTGRFASDIRPDIVRIVNEDPRRAAQIVANAAEGDGLIARQRANGAKGGAFGRGSNTVFNNLYDAQAQLGRRYDPNNPVTFYATSPVITGLDGASNFNLVIPQTQEIAQHIAGFDKNKLISPILVSDGTNYRGFLPVNKFNVQNLNPRKVLTNEEQKAKVVETLYAILQHPDIPDAAKTELLQMNGKDIFGAVRNINDNSDLALDFGRLGRFAGALRNDKQFVKSAGGNTWADLTRLQKQMSGAAALDRTFNNQFARLKSDEALAGVAFDYDPNTRSLLQRQFKQPPIVLDGVKLNIDQNVIDAGKLKQQAKSQQYKNIELDNPDSEYGLFIKDVDKLDSGRTTPDTKKILGGGNIIFANERLEPDVAKGLRYQYITSFENSVNQLLKQNAQRQVSGNALDTVKDLGLPEININSPVGTIGYTLEQVVGDDGIAVRNEPRIAMVGYDHNTKQPRLRLGHKDNPIGVGLMGDTATIHFKDDADIRHPLGDIQRRTNQLGEEVIELPSPLNNLVTGTVLEPKPEDLAEFDLVFRPGEDKLKALAKLMFIEPKVLDDGNVSYPVIKKRQANDIDNYLNTEFAADDVQGQLLAKSLNYGSPNFTALKNLGIQPNPSSMAGRGLKVNILDQPSATTILPVSWDIKNQTEMLDPTGVAHQMEWDDLYAAQMVKGVDDAGNPIVADSIVLPYNEATGNRKLLGSVERAYERLTGAKPTINYMPAEDGTLIAYIGNKPEQVRYFRNDWDRESLIDTRKVDRAIGRWLGVDDVNLPSEPLVTEKVNTQNIDQVMREITNPDNGSVYDKQYIRSDRPIDILKNPNEYFGSGIGAYDERTGDLYNIGDPISGKASRYSLALKTFFDPRTASRIEDVPAIFKTPEFLARYNDADHTSLVLNTDEVDALERWLGDNVTFKEGQSQSATPYTIIEQEARDSQTPFIYRQKVGTAADDLKNTHITSDGSSVYFPSRRNIQLGMDPNDIASVRTTYYPSLNQDERVVYSVVGEPNQLPRFSTVIQPDSVDQSSVRDLYPNSPISYDADGKLVKVYHPLWSDGTTEPKYSTVLNSAAIRNQVDVQSPARTAVVIDPADITVQMNHDIPLIEHYYNLEQKALARGDTKAANFYRTEREIAQYVASRKPILREDPLEGLNLNNASINVINDYLPVDQQIATSDGITSTNEPAIWRNDDAVGWSEQGRLEPAVTYELTDPEGIAIRKDGNPALRVNPNYIQQVQAGNVIDGIAAKDNGIYISVPEEIDQAISDDVQRMAMAEKQRFADEILYRNPVKDKEMVLDPVVKAELDDLQTVSVRNDQPSSTRATINKIIALSPQGQTVQSVVEVPTQPIVPEQSNTIGGNPQTGVGTPSTTDTQNWWNNLSQEQKLMVLGLGGLGAYGLYDAINQSQQQSYAVRAA